MARRIPFSLAPSLERRRRTPGDLYVLLPFMSAEKGVYSPLHLLWVAGNNNRRSEKETAGIKPNDAGARALSDRPDSSK